MKNRSTLEFIASATVAFVVAISVSGCKPAVDMAPPEVNEEAPSASSAPDRAKKETREAAEAVSDYSFAQRTEYRARMHAQVSAMKRDLDALAAKVESSTSAAKEEAKTKIQQLRGQLDKVEEKLDGAKDSTESTWADFKSGMKKAVDDVKDGVNNARQWLSDKIAP